jgi:phospholipid/cholesterol/gamma-HCH transport system substrate-binding protein
MKQHTVELTVGIFVFVMLLSVGYLTVRLGKMEILGNDFYTLHARFESAGGLRSGSSVEIAGVQVGRVTAIRLDQDMYAALVEMKIRKDVTITDDAIASIKTSGLIGDKFLRISPGGSDVVLQPGDMMIETQSPLDIEDLVSRYIFGGGKGEGEFDQF